MNSLRKDALTKAMNVFTVENKVFGWAEIAAAAEVWGEWQPFVQATRQALACLQHAAQVNQPAPADAVKEAATAFRYAHNLISAQETQTWLQRWGMSVEDWMNYLRGQLLRERWAGRLDQLVAEHAVSDEQVNAVLKSYAVCADKFEAWAHKLAGRAAVIAPSGSLDAGHQPHDNLARNLVARIESEFDRIRQRTVTPQRIAAKIAAHQLDWIRFGCRYVWFPEERLAREAAFCLREDGLTLDEVAYDARSIVQQWDFYLDEVETPARPNFLAARQGDWLGPVKMLEGFPLFAIEQKQMPSSADPCIRRRAEEAILASLIEAESNKRVKWQRA
jgi:hypothetical protein